MAYIFKFILPRVFRYSIKTKHNPSPNGITQITSLRGKTKTKTTSAKCFEKAHVKNVF